MPITKTDLDFLWQQAKNLKSYHELLQYIDNLPNSKSKERLKNSVEEILGDFESTSPNIEKLLDADILPQGKTLVDVAPKKRVEHPPFYFDENKQEWLTLDGHAIGSHELKAHGLI